jgi:hypothetical protein
VPEYFLVLKQQLIGLLLDGAGVTVNIYDKIIFTKTQFL